MVGIIIIGQIELSPFSKKYISVMEEKNIPYEIVHWNRSGIENKDDSKYHTYFEQVDRYGKLASKIMPFLHFRKFAKSVIKEKKYEKLIILTTQTAVVLFDLLLGKKYKNKYFFDYRDTSYEYIGFYKKFIDRIIINSYATCISSNGFRKYLTDKKELIIAHNFQDDYYSARVMSCAPRQKNNKIIIGYIGYLREYDYLIKFVDAFGKDERFEFHIHGSGDCEEKLRDYASKYDNVTVYGAYNEKDKMKIVDSFDMICYNYPYSFVNYPAVANKFYDGMIRKKPMFGNKETFSGQTIEEYGLGISLAEDESEMTQKIFDYFLAFDREEFEKNCEDYLLSVLNDDKIYIKKINEFLDS